MVEDLIKLGLEPAFGRLGLVGSSGGYTYYMYTSHASPRACGARLGRIMQERPCDEKKQTHVGDF